MSFDRNSSTDFAVDGCRTSKKKCAGNAPNRWKNCTKKRQVCMRGVTNACTAIGRPLSLSPASSKPSHWSMTPSQEPQSPESGMPVMGRSTLTLTLTHPEHSFISDHHKDWEAAVTDHCLATQAPTTARGLLSVRQAEDAEGCANPEWLMMNQPIDPMKGKINLEGN